MLSRDAYVRLLLDSASDFAITPIIDPETQFGLASVDLRLGPDIIVTRRATGLVAYDPADVGKGDEEISSYQSYVRRPFGSRFYLHPDEFAIARTLESVSLPSTLSAQAMGRSSWGRLGLVVATATFIQPEFEGTITLELSNLGTIPLVLYVGMRIAQVAFHPLTD